MAEECRKLGASTTELLQILRKGDDVSAAITEANARLEAVTKLVDTLSGQLKGDSADILADLVDDELAEMDKAIEEAAKRIEVFN